MLGTLRDARTIRAARAVLRDLVFEVVPGVVGRQIRAGSIADLLIVPSSVAVGAETALVTGERNVSLTLAKYDLADLQSRVVGVRPPVRRAGPRGLRSLLGESSEVALAGESDDRELAGCLEQIAEDVARDELFLTVMLEVSPRDTRTPSERMRLTNGFKKLPPDYWPRDFEITDAYLTNAPSVGPLRRFYLCAARSRRAALTPRPPNARRTSGGSGSSMSAANEGLKSFLPGTRSAGSRTGGSATRRARGTPARVMMIVSPRAARSTSAENCVRAALMFTKVGSRLATRDAYQWDA